MATFTSELTRQSDNYVFGIKELTELFDRASHEAVTIMIVFQVLCISFLIRKFSTFLNVIIWLSFAFLMYTIAGPYLFLQWFLVISSLLWHCCVILWTHPYLVAASFVGYGAYRLMNYLYIRHPISMDTDETESLKTVLAQLYAMENSNKKLCEQLLNVKETVEALKEGQSCCGQENENENESQSDTSLLDNMYPLDLKRSRSIEQRKSRRIQARRRLRSSDASCR